MKILYIDTTTSDLVVAFVNDNDVVSVSQESMGVKHSETLCAKVNELLKNTNSSFGEIDAYACAIGPGSFTGIRIGISTVKGFVTANPKPCIAVNSLEAISRSKVCKGNGSAIIDAGNGYYYYNRTDGVCPTVVAYDDGITDGAATADGALDYFDGAVEIIIDKFKRGQFDTSLVPLYIRRSQAEINLKRADNK